MKVTFGHECQFSVENVFFQNFSKGAGQGHRPINTPIEIDNNRKRNCSTCAYQPCRSIPSMPLPDGRWPAVYGVWEMNVCFRPAPAPWQIRCINRNTVDKIVKNFSMQWHTQRGIKRVQLRAKPFAISSVVWPFGLFLIFAFGRYSMHCQDDDWWCLLYIHTYFI